MKNRTSKKNEWFSIYKPSKSRFLVILVRQVSHSHDVITLSRIVNKVNLMEKGQFRGPQMATYLALNFVKFGMSPFYPLNCYILEAFKIEESVRQKMGAEQRQLKNFEQCRKLPHF